jgi:predicted PolB exonuclease-like 3'-5' exonuclease
VIVAIDIETIPNAAMVSRLPEPKIDSRLKDPAKIADAKANAKADQIGAMALDALTARVCCFAVCGYASGPDTVELTHGDIIKADTDIQERELIQSIMQMLGNSEMRLVSWNGIGFDLPMIYKRAMILGIDPAHFGAPPLPTWCKRYSTDKHYDLMQIWGGWSSQGWAKLETVASLILGEHRADIPYEQVPELIKTEEGRKSVLDGCMNHTKLTWELWKKFNGTMFV